MIDFLMISTRSTKRGVIEIYPKFIIKKSSDLMIRGGDFYAVWNEDRGLWSTDEDDVTQLIDRELSRYAEEYKGTFEGNVKTLYIGSSITSIGYYAFAGCENLIKIQIPSTVTSIGDDVFEGCKSLEEIIFRLTATSLLSAM